jgi:hypothetical protein
MALRAEGASALELNETKIDESQERVQVPYIDARRPYVGTLKSDQQYPLGAAGQYRNSGRLSAQYCSIRHVQTTCGERQDMVGPTTPITLQRRWGLPANYVGRMRICHQFTLSSPRATISAS